MRREGAIAQAGPRSARDRTPEVYRSPIDEKLDKVLNATGHICRY